MHQKRATCNCMILLLGAAATTAAFAAFSLRVMSKFSVADGSSSSLLFASVLHFERSVLSPTFWQKAMPEWPC